jgi:AcrR family transcriptional regulator
MLALWDREVGVVHRRIEQATLDATSLDEVIDRAVSAYLDVLHERGSFLGTLQTQLSHGSLEERTRDRVRDFVAFWQRRLKAFLPLDRAGAMAAAAMAPAAVDACARVWGAGLLSRAETARLARQFVLAGTRAVAAAKAPARGRARSVRVPARASR